MLNERISNKTQFIRLSTHVCGASRCAEAGDATIGVMRRLSVLLACLFLAACGGSSTSTAVVCDQQYWDGTVGTCLPEGWHVVDAGDLQARGAPREVIAAFQADEAIAGRFPLVTVTDQQLPSGQKPKEFDVQSRLSVKTLPGYALVDEREVAVDSVPYTLHVFTAQPIAEEPVQRFYQLSAAGESRGFTFTGALPLTVSNAEEERLLTLLTHVTLVHAAEEE